MMMMTMTTTDHHYIYGNMLDLIFFKVESSMQLLSEIYGYLFKHVKRSCMALSDLCRDFTFLEPIVQELCESRGGRPGLSVLTSLLVSVDVKLC